MTGATSASAHSRAMPRTACCSADSSKFTGEFGRAGRPSGGGRRVPSSAQTSSPRAPPRSGASACPPIPPKRGVRSPPRLRRGRLARRNRPALRGALRLVGFAPDGTRPTPTSRTTGAVSSAFSAGRVQSRHGESCGGGGSDVAAVGTAGGAGGGHGQGQGDAVLAATGGYGRARCHGRAGCQADRGQRRRAAADLFPLCRRLRGLDRGGRRGTGGADAVARV